MILTGPKKLVSKRSRVSDRVSGVVDNSSTAPMTAILMSDSFSSHTYSFARGERQNLRYNCRTGYRSSQKRPALPLQQLGRDSDTYSPHQRIS